MKFISYQRIGANDYLTVETPRGRWRTFIWQVGEGGAEGFWLEIQRRGALTRLVQTSRALSDLLSELLDLAVNANKRRVERYGHKLRSLGCAEYRCEWCGLRLFLDTQGDLPVATCPGATKEVKQ